MEPTKVRRISEVYQARIDALYSEHLTPLQIRKRLLAENNVSISSQAIKLYIARRMDEKISGRRRTAARPRPEKRKLTPEHLAYIDMAYEADDETTAPELQRRLKERFGLEVGTSTIKRARKQLGWTSGTARYCQIVRDVNKEKRKLYCIDAMVREEQFDDVIFTDECTVKLQSNVRLSFRRRDGCRRLKGIPKHPYQVHVWAGISRRGATQIAVFTGRLKSDGYQTILNNYLVPFIKDVYPDGHRLYQDNDPKHTSRATKQWMEENGIKLLAAPPESPDLNPIEMMWASLKYHIRRRVKPRNKEELVNGIQDFWESRDIETCNKYINHLYTVIPMVVQQNGAASGE